MSIERTATNKARRAKARERWLKKRQSEEVRREMASTWLARRPNYFEEHPQIKRTVVRYGIPVFHVPLASA